VDTGGKGKLGEDRQAYRSAQMAAIPGAAAWAPRIPPDCIVTGRTAALDQWPRSRACPRG